MKPEVAVQRVKDKARLDLECLFSEAEGALLEFERYCKFDAVSHPVEHVRNVLKCVGFLVELKNLDYYERSLAQKKRESQRSISR